MNYSNLQLHKAYFKNLTEIYTILEKDREELFFIEYFELRKMIVEVTEAMRKVVNSPINELKTSLEKYRKIREVLNYLVEISYMQFNRRESSPLYSPRGLQKIKSMWENSRKFPQYFIYFQLEVYGTDDFYHFEKKIKEFEYCNNYNPMEVNQDLDEEFKALEYTPNIDLALEQLKNKLNLS